MCKDKHLKDKRLLKVLHKFFKKKSEGATDFRYKVRASPQVFRIVKVFYK